MKLRRLKITKFRNVQPGTELAFHDGFNVLLGQNGTGKTTLLRLITSVLRGNFEWLENEPFSFEADLEFGDNRISFSIAHERKARDDNPLEGVLAELRSFIPTKEKWSTTVDSRLTTGEGEVWQFHWVGGIITVTGPGQSEPARLEQGWSPLQDVHLINVAFTAGYYAQHRDHGSTQSSIDTGDFLRMSADVRNTGRFDESLELFSAITGRCSAIGKEEYGRITGRINLIPIRTDRAITVVDAFMPPAIKEFDGLKNIDFDSPADSLTIWHDHAPFLATVINMLGFSAAEVKLDLIGKEVTEQQKTLEYGNLRFLFHGRDGSIVNQDHLSYGQKRLLTFFYYLACNQHVVVADELVNGLHYAWIAECIRAMGDRQVFVTSQNPILLDHLTFDSVDDVRHTFITCQAKDEGVRDRITWGNMSKKNAEAFFRAYKVGIQHVGEILRTKGLW